MTSPRSKHGHGSIFHVLALASLSLSLLKQAQGFLSPISQSSYTPLALKPRTRAPLSALRMAAAEEEECPEIPTSPQLLPSGDVAVLALG
mmetsp:Transcript_9534/g.13309  ORF Transcript_9534/g.13309 Transcript_9534/m.13309 type:complete len:90 (-) Transcript_9534:651-920(-)